MASASGDVTARLNEVKEKMLAVVTSENQRDTERRNQSKPASVWRDFSGAAMRPRFPYNEVTSNIILGDGSITQKKDVLRRMKITHVINACQGKRKMFQIDTDQDYYNDYDIKFYGLENAMDTAGFNISVYFKSAADFIDSCVSTNGKVYVHCYQGISRSATLVAAYLMIKKSYSLDDALAMLRKVREVHPNNGFLKQLIKLEDELKG